MDFLIGFTIFLALANKLQAGGGVFYDDYQYHTRPPPKTLPLYRSNRLIELTRPRDNSVDLIFLLPSSLKTGPELQGALDVLNKMGTLFMQNNRFGQANGLRLSFVTYALVAEVVSDLTSGGSIAEIQAPNFKVDNNGTLINLHEALETAWELFIKQGRPGANKVLVLFIGSNAIVGEEKVRYVAKKLTSLGVEIWVVAGGRVDADLVLSIATEPHVIYFENFTQSSVVIFKLVSFKPRPRTTITP